MNLKLNLKKKKILLKFEIHLKSWIFFMHLRFNLRFKIQDFTIQQPTYYNIIFMVPVESVYNLAKILITSRYRLGGGPIKGRLMCNWVKCFGRPKVNWNSSLLSVSGIDVVPILHFRSPKTLYSIAWKEGRWFHRWIKRRCCVVIIIS